MALVKCPNCGKEISDKAQLCPGCGNALIQEEGQVEKCFCSECGVEISPNEEICHNCGCPLSSPNNNIQKDATENVIVQDSEKIEKEIKDFEDKKMIKKSKKLTIVLSSIVLVILLGVGSFFAISSLRMNTLEESIYDALVIAAQDMKNPSAMKVLQIGTVEKDGNGKMTNCIIKFQSTTAVGAVNTEEVILSSTGYFMTTKELTSGWLSGLTAGIKDKYDIDDNNENVSIKKINAALKKHWKEIGIE